MKRVPVLPLALALVAALILAWPADPAGAIPAFARKHHLSCSTCHAPIPRLRPFGEMFAANGFRLGDPPQEPEGAVQETGDELLQLNSDLPLAVRIEGYAAYKENQEAEADLETPFVFKLLSGGTIAPKVSYYMYFIIEQGEVTGLEDAFLLFQKVFGSGVDITFGQFQISDPMFKRELRLERSDYEILKRRVGEVKANLTYDRGLMFSGTLPGEIETVVTVVNGNGIPKGEFDQDSQKNLALRLARKFGPVRVGLFGYTGKEEAENGFSDTMTYWGPDLKIAPGGKWELNAQYLERRDDNPFFLEGSARDVVTRGGFAELLFFPGGQHGRWALYALYNRIDSDDPAAELEDVAAGATREIRRNIRFVVEAGHDFDFEESRASLGVVAAF